MPVTLAALNAASPDEFTSALAHLFEHSPWVAAETWPRRPFRDAAHLHSELCRTMHAAAHEQQLALIRAHPDLAGRMPLTSASATEQSRAGLDRLSEQELAVFHNLNAEYRARFGIPFIICARLNDRAAILAAMQSRLSGDSATEHAAALAEIEKIAWLRLQDSLA